MKNNEVHKPSDLSKEVTKEKLGNENDFSNVLFIENKNMQLTKNLKSPQEKYNLSEKETTADNKENENNNILEKNVECLSCEPGYTINSEKTCTYCGNGCEICSKRMYDRRRQRCWQEVLSVDNH